MRIRPTKNRVLILADPDLPDESSGVVLPPDKHDFPTRGVVLRVGPGCTELEEGDVVHFNPNAAQLRIPATEGRTLVIMRESRAGFDPLDTIACYELES